MHIKIFKFHCTIDNTKRYRVSIILIIINVLRNISDTWHYRLTVILLCERSLRRNFFLILINFLCTFFPLKYLKKLLLLNEIQRICLKQAALTSTITNILKSRLHGIIKSVSQLRSGNNYDILCFYVFPKGDKRTTITNSSQTDAKRQKNILKFRFL